MALAIALGLALPGMAAAAPNASGRGWTWPLEPRPAVARAFDPPAKPWLSGHRGVDLASAPGAPVLAPEAGTVVFAGQVVDRPVVTLDHGEGLRSSFEPVTADIAVGDHVAKGARLGHLWDAAGAEGGHCSPQACLHWGVRRGEDYVDPLAFIEDRRPSVLLPWDGP